MQSVALSGISTVALIRVILNLGVKGKHPEYGCSNGDENKAVLNFGGENKAVLNSGVITIWG